MPHFLCWILNFLTRWEPVGGNGSMYKKLLKGHRGLLMFSCPNHINKIYTKQQKNIVQKQENREE